MMNHKSSKFVLTIIAAAALTVGLTGLTGCGTTAATKAAQAERIVIDSVNAGMTEWAAHVNAGLAKRSQIEAVKNAYTGYYTAQLVAKALIERLAVAENSGGSVPVPTAAEIAMANAAVSNAESALLALLNQLLGSAVAPPLFTPMPGA